MTAFDFSPLYRSTIGFDRLARLLDSAGQVETSASSFPPYNIEQIDQDNYRITMAVAGFSEKDLDLQVKENTLTITGNGGSEADAETTYLHRGIAARSFERRFQLADHVHVTGADLRNGLLHIELVREIPEEKKVRKIAIGRKTGKLSGPEPKAA